MFALTAFAAVLGALLLVPFSAAAAGIRPGYQQPGKPLNHLGGYLTSHGHVVYCIDAGQPSAVGHETADSGTVSSVQGLAPPEMLRLNTLLARHRDTADGDPGTGRPVPFRGGGHHATGTNGGAVDQCGAVGQY